MEWKDIEYFVKASKSDISSSKKDEPKIVETGHPKTTLIKKTKFGLKKTYKQVVMTNSGHLKPFELLGILGPSGAGKTSLLNVFSQRPST